MKRKGKTIMAKTIQVLKLNANGRRFSAVYKVDTSMYILYRHTRELNNYGYYTERKRIEMKADNICAVLRYTEAAMGW